MSRRERPLVVANFAVTADGKISTRRRTPAQFSSPRDKRTLLEIRARADAILVGRATVSTDAMTMGLPSAKLRAQPVLSPIAREPWPDSRQKCGSRDRLSASCRAVKSRGAA